MANKFRVGDRVRRINVDNNYLDGRGVFHVGDEGIVKDIRCDGWVDVNVGGRQFDNNDPANLELVEPQFKIGDEVIGNEKADVRYGVTKTGWRGVVVKTCNDGKQIEVKGPGYNGKDVTTFWVDAEYFDFVGPDKIVITTDGKTTTAKRFRGKTEIKHTTARCAPDDKFDFETGAGIAVARLLGREFAAPEEKPFDKNMLTNGRFGHTSDGKWFVVVGDKLMYDTASGGRYDTIHTDGCYFHYEIDAIVEAVSFREAKDGSHGDRKIIWSRSGAKLD